MEKVCRECGQPFATEKKTKIFCSKPCAHRNWVKRNKEKVSQYSKEHYQINKERYKQNMEKWHEENPEWSKNYYRKYYKENREEMLKRSYSWRYRNREKVRAHAKIRRDLIDGKIAKPQYCERCSKEILLEAHHPDYNQKDSVIWLCRKCHKAIHKLNKNENG